MSGPYDAVRAAVAGYAVTAASPSATSPGSPAATPGGNFSGTEPAVGVWDPKIGALVATYPSEAFPRALEAVAMQCSEICQVSIYYGAITPATRISSYGDGSLTDYSPPIARFIPPDARVFVVWSTSSSTQTGTANAQIRRIT